MNRYAIVIEKAKSNDGGYVPNLPGCVATGKTVGETEQLLREAIETHLGGMHQDGIPAPEPSSQVRYVEVNSPSEHDLLRIPLLRNRVLEADSPGGRRDYADGQAER